MIESGRFCTRGSGVSPLENKEAPSTLKRRDAASPKDGCLVASLGMPPAPRFFSRFASTICTEANLPHWDQDGVTCFVTFRLADSLPRERLLKFIDLRTSWLQAHPYPWDEAAAREYAESFDGVAEKWLDEGLGRCVLRNPENRLLVEKALRYFDGSRYHLYAFVVMPNHVHVLFMPEKGESIAKILHSWKSFTAHRLKSFVGVDEPVWQKESWDRLVRNAEHFKRVLRYIEANDSKLAWSVYDGLEDDVGGRGVRGSGVSPLENKEAPSTLKRRDAASPMQVASTLNLQGEL